MPPQRKDSFDFRLVMPCDAAPCIQEVTLQECQPWKAKGLKVFVENTAATRTPQVIGDVVLQSQLEASSSVAGPMLAASSHVTAGFCRFHAGGREGGGGVLITLPPDLTSHSLKP